MNRPVSIQLLQEAAEVIRRGGLVAFPTETVYGLGADARSARAVAAIFEAKQRPRFDPLIVHVAEPEELDSLASSVPSEARVLVDQFWPGPLTLVLPRRPIVPDIVSAGLATVAVRCPSHPIARELIRLAQAPLAAPSANRFGKISPTTAEHVRQSFGDRIPFLIDGGPCGVGVESTVVSFSEGVVRLLRPGGISLEDLEAVMGPVDVGIGASAGAVASPGMLRAHYAPTTRLAWWTPQFQVGGHARVGLLSWCPPRELHLSGMEQFAAVEVLSQAADLREAAANLFAALRRLDDHGLDQILAMPVPTYGLGLAIHDRLTRAVAAADDDDVGLPGSA